MLQVREKREQFSLCIPGLLFRFTIFKSRKRSYTLGLHSALSVFTYQLALLIRIDKNKLFVLRTVNVVSSGVATSEGVMGARALP